MQFRNKQFLWCLVILVICLTLMNVFKNGRGFYWAKLCKRSATKNYIEQEADNDNQKFIHHMKYLDPSRQRAAIYYLANIDTRGLIIKDGEEFVVLKGKDGPGNLIDSLNSLQKNFLSNYSYPVIVFHEKDFRRYKKSVKEETHIKDLFFIEIKFEIPSFLVKPVPVLAPCTRRHTIGYRHMCRFQAKTIYDHPALKHMDYVLRLDDDSMIIKPIRYDIFEYFHDHNYTYGYVVDARESEACTFGLNNVIENYIVERRIKPKFYSSLPKQFIYYNNFELSKVSFWKSKEYQDFIENIDRHGGIYYNRWGDAPIKTKAVSIFLSREQIHMLRGIAYKHYGIRT